MNNFATIVIAAVVIIPGIYFLARSIHQEATEGKCASCYSRGSCDKGCCPEQKSE